jgi:hypothetical protein
MSGRVEQMNSTGGVLATAFAVFFSAATGWMAGSVDVVRAFLAGVTQGEATLLVGIIVGLLSQAGVWARWYLDRRRKRRE